MQEHHPRQVDRIRQRQRQQRLLERDVAERDGEPKDESIVEHGRHEPDRQRQREPSEPIAAYAWARIMDAGAPVHAIVAFEENPEEVEGHYFYIGGEEHRVIRLDAVILSFPAE